MRGPADTGIGSTPVARQLYAGRYADLLSATIDGEAAGCDPDDVAFVVGALAFVGRLEEAELFVVGLEVLDLDGGSVSRTRCTEVCSCEQLCLQDDLMRVSAIVRQAGERCSAAFQQIECIRIKTTDKTALLVRVEEDPDDSIVRKISLFGGVPEKRVIVLPNADTVLRVPLTLHAAGIDEEVMKLLKLKGKRPRLGPWEDIVKKATSKRKKIVHVGIVAKYVRASDRPL